MKKLKLEDQNVPIQETIFRVSNTQPLLVKGIPKEQFIMDNISRTQTFQKQIQQYHIDSPLQSRTPTMKNDSAIIQKWQHRIQYQLPKYEGDNKWPIFRLKTDPFIKQFWTRRTVKDQDRNWNYNDFIFQGIMLRIGRKKKNVKGYFYRLTSSGLFLYFKKESDTLPKGYIQLSISNRVTVSIQKTKKSNQLPVIFIERVHGVGITIFDHQIDQTLKLSESLQEFCVMRGYDAVYQQEDNLGSGAFATVFRVVRKRDEKLFAAKVYYRQGFEDNQHKEKYIVSQQMIFNEIQCLKQIYHPGIMQVYEVYQEKDRLIIIMEHCAGGTLYQVSKQRVKMTDKQIALILKGICEALLEINKYNYVHRDLKLENIMLENKDSSQIKLIDFGFAEIINDRELINKSGTPGFMPPEIFRGQPYLAKGDIFSVGAIFYMIIGGTSAFKAPRAAQIVEFNKKCQVNFEKPPWPEVNPDLKYLIKKMMEARYEDRISCSEILESPFILHHTKQTSETNYKSVQIVSGLEYKQSIKSIKHSQNSNNESKDFQLDFSIHTNDIKSLYQRNSQRTANSQRSNRSLFKNSHKIIATSKSQPKDQLAQYQALRKQSHPDHKSNVIMKSSGNENSSFGELIKSKQLKINTFEDQDTLNIDQIGFLKRSSKVFNKDKKPTC